MAELCLIDNSPAYTYEEAKKRNMESVLRYKNRICKVCKKEFDIQEQGIFYRCGCNGKD